MENSFVQPGEQPDGSVCDMYGNYTSLNDRISIIETVDSLPVSLFRKEIEDIVSNNSVSIIQWETGSGKTTQVWKYLMQKWFKVVNTVPKVLSAVSVSERVSHELLCETWNPEYSLGYDVGYRTGQWNSSRHQSWLSFHTDGTELMRWNMSWSNTDVLIIDEVHNFSVPTEILVAKVKNEMLKTKKDIRLIIMSATLDPQLFQDYFKGISNDIPLISIPWRTFPVEKYYNNWNNPAKTVSTYAAKWNNILVFCKWKTEIEEMMSAISATFQKEYLNLEVPEILPLHAELPVDYQQSLLKEPELWKSRIIVSTNVAEESITIPYIDVVVDLWESKVMETNKFWVRELRSEPIAKANSLQRAWRAWRVKEWIYIWENKNVYEDLPEYQKAPIQRQMLEREILLNLHGGLDIRTAHLQAKQKWEKLFMHDIPSDLLELAYKRLIQIWAIKSKWGITKLWKEILKYPMSVQNARSFIESIERGCSYDMILMTAIMENQGFVEAGKRSELKLDWKKEWDLFAMVDLFRLVTSKNITQWKASQLISLGCSSYQVQEFMKTDEEKQLYEAVDLTILWINHKKIDDIYRQLKNMKSRLKKGWITLENTWSKDDIIISLIAWNKHNIFKYVKSEEWKYDVFKNNLMRKQEFKLWNTSQLEPKKWELYIWEPFTIWWEWEKPDTHLFLNVMAIEKWHIHEVKDYEMNFHNFWEIFEEEEFTLETAMDIYTDMLWDFVTKLENNKFDSEDKAKEVFLKNIVPNLMIANNNHLIKHIESQGKEFNLWAFRELLKRLIVTEKSRINLGNLEKTKRSFVDDTWVLDTYLNTEDPFISAFRRWEEFVPQEESISYTENSSIEESEINTHMLIQAQREYLKLKNSIWKYSNIWNLKRDAIQKFLWKNKEKFIPLFNFWLKIRQIPQGTLESILEWLNDIHKKETELQRYVKLQRRFNIMSDVLDKYIDWEDKLESVDFDKIPVIYPNLRNKIMKSFQNLASRDKRKQSKGLAYMKDASKTLKVISDNYEIKINELNYEISAWDISYASDLFQIINELFQSMYTPAYYDSIKSKEVLKITRNVIRKVHKWSLDLNEEIINIFINSPLNQVLGDTNMIKNIELLWDTQYALQVYLEEITKEVKESTDIDKIRKRTQELKEYIDQQKKLKQKIYHT